VSKEDGGVPYPGYTGNPYTKNPTELITQEYFGNEWVNTIPPAGGGVMSPYEHHGYIAGSPAQLTPYVPYNGPGGDNPGTRDYYVQLAERSPRVKMWDIGKSGTGLEMFIVAISAEDTIGRLEEYRENIHRLADPRKLGYPDDEKAANEAAEALINDTSKLKPIYWMLAAPHASESGSPEMAMELAYRLAVEERPMFKEIRDNVIVFLTNPNPDGRQMVSEWVNYYMTQPDWKDKEPRPPFYNLYNQHDNSRDAHINSLPEFRNEVKAYLQWPAQVIYAPHESHFLLWILSPRPPTHPSIDPITQTEWLWLASRTLNQMEQFGSPGVWCYHFISQWHPCSEIQVANQRSATGTCTETYGHCYPNTITREGPFPGVEGKDMQKHFWFSPLPYMPEKIVWSFRNNVNYTQTVALTHLQMISRNRDTVLRNYWTKTKNAISNVGKTSIGSTGRFTWPNAYVVPSEQKDMPDTIAMINNLLENGIEVHTADKKFSIGDREYLEGSFIIDQRQPSSRLMHSLFTSFFWPDLDQGPELEPIRKPYDASAWQYNLIRDVECDRIDDPAIYDVPMTLIASEQIECPYTVSPKITEGYYAIDHRGINNIVTLVFRLDKGGYTCYTTDKGDIIIPADQAGVYEAVESLVSEFGLTMHNTPDPKMEIHKINVPRVAVYHSWRAIQDGGWSRYTFEFFGVPYELIQRQDVRQGDLRDKYDVIFLPNVTAESMKEGDSRGDVPEEVWYGPVQTTQRTGGLGNDGIAALKQFVNDGGLLICNNDSSNLPVEYNFIPDGITIFKARIEGDSYFDASSPIVRIKPKVGNPICYGASEEQCIYQNQSPAFMAPKEWVVASYPDDPDKILLSGYLQGAKVLAGKAAIIAAPAKDGTGTVVMFGTDITRRMQVYGSYFYLWNAILNWDNLR